VQKTLDALARREHTPAQQRDAVQRLVQLVVNKLLHPPTAALREAATPDEAALRAEVLCDLFGLEPVAGDGREAGGAGEAAGPDEAGTGPVPRPADKPGGKEREAAT